ncbi:terminase large subunit [Salinispora arenicola]|uniref:terminase large subunit n=1 Tax=Salinispora arenicola TaxID=168697 RepID=UPI00036F4556|nr:terminase large subunit [Salinispora arenicola]
MRGRVEPRLWTPPLRDLTQPDATYGYELIDFAEAIGWPLDSWQQWLAIHLGELLPDGTPRFRIALVLVARQNGKSVFCRILTLYWMFIDAAPLIFGINSSRDTAKKSWKEVIKMAESTPILARELPAVHVVKQISEEDFWNVHDSHYTFGAPNSRAGRSLTVNKAIIDELRQHKNRDAWDALIPTMNAVPDAQAVIITNEGDESAAVLHELADAAASYIETGTGDARLGMFSWSAPRGSNPTDLEALAYANPDLDNRLQADALLGQAMQAVAAGGETLARFRIEMMCQRITSLNPAVDPDAWATCGTSQPIDLAEHRQHVALCLDVALDASHASLVAAAAIDGVVHVEVVQTWIGHGCTQALRRELPDLVARIRPRRVGWFPAGPAAAVAASVRTKSGSRSWAPRRTDVAELTAETPAVCMGLADIAGSGELRHPDDPALNAHIAAAERLPRGDAWTFGRKGAAPIDLAYATAGAVHLARTLPPAPPPLTIA